MEQREQNGKDVSLEALRGIAAIIVVFWHSCLAFLPKRSGEFAQYADLSWRGNPLFVLINGQSAVALFFVLSGYVLTRKYFLTEQLPGLVRGAIKRWPRFVGPVFMAVFASYLCFRFDLYSFYPAGQRSGSPWLDTFGWEFSDAVPHINIWRALKEATYAVFFREEALFDTSLWTMHTEFIGSFMVFGMAPLLAEARKIASWAVVFLSGCVILISANSSMPGLVAFPVGVTIAAVLPSRHTIPKLSFYGLLAASIYLLGYSGKGVGMYYAFNVFPLNDRYASYPAVAGSAILIGLFELHQPLKTRFSGTLSRWLGEFSFPIYLIHALIIFSLGSAVYLRYGTVAAFASVFITTPIAALPLLFFDRAWVAIINRAVNRIVPRSDKSPMKIADLSRSLVEPPTVEFSGALEAAGPPEVVAGGQWTEQREAEQ